jgi:tetratricopeptide (TPR) repeat protein
MLVGTLAVAGAATLAWRHRRVLELEQARAEIDRGAYVSALGRLESLAALRLTWMDGGPGELDYLLGTCRWRSGRRDDALAAFARVPEGSRYGTSAAAMTATGLLEKGHWRAAEERLERALGPAPQAAPASAVLAAGRPPLPRRARRNRGMGQSSRSVSRSGKSSRRWGTTSSKMLLCQSSSAACSANDVRADHTASGGTAW